jgi:uncharacterized protein YggE
MEIPQQYVRNIYKAIFVLVIVLSAFFAVKILAEVRSYSMIGSSDTHTITLSGHGEVNAAPDIASVSLTIESSASPQSAASDVVNTKTAKILEFLKSSGIDEKDIKTDNYSSYPKYSYPQPCPVYANGTMPPCRESESKIVGYTVSQNITVKIRKADDVSSITDGINKIGVTSMYGPNFTFDDPDKLEADARKEAIKDAHDKAETLAKDLGVHLGRIVSYSEGGYGGPMYYAKDAVMAESRAGSAPAPSIPKGENTLTSDVSITYEIK